METRGQSLEQGLELVEWSSQLVWSILERMERSHIVE